MSLLNANTLLVASIVGVSGISSMLLSGIFSWGTKEKRMEDHAREADLQLSSIYAMIRSESHRVLWRPFRLSQAATA